MIAGGSHIEPTVGGAKKWVRTRSHRHVLGSLRDPDLKPGWTGSAAEASRGVLTLHRPNRIYIHRGRDVIGLVAHIPELQSEVRRNRSFNLQGPLLDRRRVHFRIETADRINRTRRLPQ